MWQSPKLPGKHWYYVNRKLLYDINSRETFIFEGRKPILEVPVLSILRSMDLIGYIK